MKVVSSSSSSLLFRSLKLPIPILRALPLCLDGRSPLSKALPVALILPDFQMDAEVISAGILREVLEAGTNFLLLELGDLFFRNLFACLYFYVDIWLRSHETGIKPLIDVYKEHLLQSLEADHLLAEMVDDISIKVDVSEGGWIIPLMEIQILTTNMDMISSGSTASHSLCEGGVIDPEEVQIMHNLEDKDDQYRTMLNEKLQMPESNGQTQVYRKELMIGLQ